MGRAVAGVLGPPHPDLVAVPAELVDSAAEAIDLARRLRRDGDTSFQVFLKLMVGGVRIARTRTA